MRWRLKGSGTFSTYLAGSSHSLFQMWQMTGDPLTEIVRCGKIIDDLNFKGTKERPCLILIIFNSQPSLCGVAWRPHLPQAWTQVAIVTCMDSRLHGTSTGPGLEMPIFCGMLRARDRWHDLAPFGYFSNRWEPGRNQSSCTIQTVSA